MITIAVRVAFFIVAVGGASGLLASKASAKDSCYIYCSAGCRISQGPSYQNSTDIYEEMSRTEFMKSLAGVSVPQRPSVFEKLHELQESGQCRVSLLTQGSCRLEINNSRYVTGYDINIDGPNQRTVQSTSFADGPKVIEQLVNLGQCRR